MRGQAAQYAGVSSAPSKRAFRVLSIHWRHGGAPQQIFFLQSSCERVCRCLSIPCAIGFFRRPLHGVYRQLSNNYNEFDNKGF